MMLNYLTSECTADNHNYNNNTFQLTVTLCLNVTHLSKLIHRRLLQVALQNVWKRGPDVSLSFAVERMRRVM